MVSCLAAGSRHLELLLAHSAEFDGHQHLIVHQIDGTDRTINLEAAGFCTILDAAAPIRQIIQ